MDFIDLIIRKRDGVVFEGKVYAVSSTNEIGPFDVLPLHANFVCTIKDYLTVHIDEALKNEKKFPLETGVMRVKENKVEIYMGI